MRLVRFSAAGSSPRLGAVLGPWNHWEWVVDLAAADPEIPGDAIPPMRFETFEGSSSKTVQSSKMDYEAEIGFVLGQGGRDIPAARATEHLFGVTIFNDFSARDIQMAAGKIGMGPAPGKDWANALGPCIVTRDEFGELRDQSVVVRVNNEERLRDR